MKINKAVLDKMKKQLCGLVDDYGNDIDKAFLNVKGKLKVGLSTDLDVGFGDKIAVCSGISFIGLKIVDKTEIELVGDHPLFEESKKTGPRTVLVPYGPKKYQVIVKWIDAPDIPLTGKGLRIPGGRGRRR